LRARSTAAAGSATLRVISARWAPPMRKRRVTARVSMPAMPATPCLAMKSGRLSWARQFDTREARLRTTKPAQNGCTTRSLRVDADVADLGRGHHHDLAAVRRIGEDFLVAGDGGVEDQLAGLIRHRAEAVPR
jgi:hypothetical protein